MERGQIGMLGDIETVLTAYTEDVNAVAQALYPSENRASLHCYCFSRILTIDASTT